MRRRQEQIQRERIQFFEIMWAAVCTFIMFFALALNYNEVDCGGYKTWLKVSLGFYLTDLFVCMNQLMYVKKQRHESIWLLLLMFIILVTNTCWYIYGNVIYYKNKDVCGDTKLVGAAPELTSTMWIMIIMGYSTMLKCCCLSTLVAYLVHLTRNMGLFG